MLLPVLPKLNNTGRNNPRIAPALHRSSGDTQRTKLSFFSFAAPGKGGCSLSFGKRQRLLKCCVHTCSALFSPVAGGGGALMMGNSGGNLGDRTGNLLEFLLKVSLHLLSVTKGRSF